MDLKEIYCSIDDVSDRTRRLQEDLTMLMYMDIYKSFQGYSQLTSAIAIKSEHLTRRLRKLVFDTTDIPKSSYLLEAACALEISATENNSIVEIIIPCLLPSRKNNPTDFITAPLQETLSGFVSGHPNFERFGRCVICFTHVYTLSRCKRGGIRDHDNVEIKPVIDSINLFLLTDDASGLCNIYSSSAFGEKDMTLISIMNCDRFSEWIVTQKGMS
jgi:hypothetical protein